MATSLAEVATGIPGLVHAYPLNKTYGASDAVGKCDGVVKGTGVTFGDTCATFAGTGHVEVADHADFSAVTTGGLSIVSTLRVLSWKHAGGKEYVHWMGKGKSGAHEYCFRMYVDGGTGEAAQRQGRTSFYAFNLSGGLGAGSYFQDAEDKTLRHVVGTLDARNTSIWRDGVQRDVDPLSGYNVKLANGGAPFCMGSRGDGTGYLVGELSNVLVFNRVLTSAQVKALSAAKSLPWDDPRPDPEPEPEPPTVTEPPNPGAPYIATNATDVVGKHNALVNALADRGLLDPVVQSGA